MLAAMEMERTAVASLGRASFVRGHRIGGWESQGGPDHQRVEVIKSEALTPLLAKSAGLSVVGTCLHLVEGRRSCIT